MEFLISTKSYKKIFKLSERIIIDATNKLRNALQNNVFLANIYDFPVISENSFGPFPTFSNNFMGKEPIDYTYIFSHYEDKKILYTELDGYNDLISFFLEHKRIAKIFVIDIKTNQAEKIYIPFIIDLIKRYLTLYKADFNKSEFVKLFIEITNFYVKSTLGLDMWVPILLTNFEKDYIDIDDNYYIKRLSNIEQLSRCRVKYYGSGVHDTVMGLANFVLVRKNLKLNLPEPHVNFSLSTFDPNYFAKDEIDLYFLSQAIVCGKKSGYAQVIYNPFNWGTSYKGNLIPLTGFSIREYPEYFDNYVWLNKENFIQISDKEMDEIKELFTYFKESNSKKLKNALNRLKFCLLRKNKEDSLLDAVIAMESLLDDESQGEITFKISLRMSYIISIYNKNIDPNETFDAMRKIYKTRSKIVHGNELKENDLKIKFNKQEYILSELAINLLCWSIKAIKKDKEILNKLDKKIRDSFI